MILIPGDDFEKSELEDLRKEVQDFNKKNNNKFKDSEERDYHRKKNNRGKKA